MIVTPSRIQARLIRSRRIAQVGQLDPVVAAEHLGRVAGGVRDDGAVGVDQQRDHVGQVLLALGVLGGELAEGLHQQRRLERVHAGVDLADRPLVGGRVALLDDRVHGAGDGLRITRPRPYGFSTSAVRMVAAAPTASCASTSEVSVPGRSSGTSPLTTTTVPDSGPALERQPGRMPGAALLLLQHGQRVRGDLGQVRAELVRAVPDDHDPAARMQRSGGGEDVTEQAAAEQRMEHLR